MLVKAKESQYPVLIAPLQKIADSTEVIILVLGAGHSHTSGFTVNDRLSDTALKRLVEGIRLHRLLPNSKLMCSGYSSSSRQTQAEVLAETALLLGVSPKDTLMQGIPTNTEEEAVAYAQRFGNSKPLILVTSAIHMPRSMYWFEQQGVSAIPAPTHHIIQPDPGHEGFPFKPSLSKALMMDRLLHEWGGMLYAYWMKK